MGGVTVLSNSSSEDIGSAPGEKAALVTGFLKILMDLSLNPEGEGWTTVAPVAVFLPHVG